MHKYTIPMYRNIYHIALEIRWYVKSLDQYYFSKYKQN